MAENSTQKNLLLKMADLLNLKSSPERIEVYDNSHIQGAYAVGAMVVSGPDGLMKSEYRKFNIKISSIEVLAISKGIKRDAGRENFYTKNSDSFRFNKDDPTLFFLQKLRDEVHRYVIGAHRQKRSKSLMSTRLDEITGLGGIRRKNLLMRFGSTKEVSKASVNELQKVQGISRNLAEQIYNFFNTND